MAVYGPNEVPEKRDRAVLRFIRRFWGLTPWMLELTALLTFALGNLTDTYIVLGLLLLNGILGFYQEERAGQAIAYLRRQLRINARVLRDGIWSLVPARELVPGDLVRTRTGDFVPADLRIQEGALEVDQSAVTGESLAVEKQMAETVVSGSTITQGEATGLVTATGGRTFFGKTVELVQIAKPKLHMEEVTSQVVQWLLVMVGGLLVVAIVYTAVIGRNVFALLPLAVVLLVSAIPVALPTMFTISMALGSLELAKTGVLITHLSAGEDAATMDVLCADKTGTITVNRLRVVETVPLNGYSTEDALRFATLASNEANRDPIDLAVIQATRDQNVGPDGWVQHAFVPFDHATRRTAAAIENRGQKAYALKGAINAIVTSGASKEELPRIVKEVERLAAKGYRCIAVAVGPSLDKTTPVGILALADPPRADSAHLIAELRGLGISVKMLTGDALPIAKELAQEVGLGDGIARMVDVKSGLHEGYDVGVIESSSGFAEIFPEDKYLVVKALQERHHTVGMTGDGVNDAPALKQAEVGIAVSNATDVAKKSASVVLTNPGLAGTIDLIKSGRRIYQRIITWILNKVVKTFQIVVFVVLAFLLTGDYIVSVFTMILFLFVTDFVTLSLATDTVRYSETPDTWDIRGLVFVSIGLGALIVAESLVFLFLGLNFLGFGSDLRGLQTFIFDYLVFLGVLNVLVLRERNHFWTSAPSTPLLTAVSLDLLVVAAISATGFFELQPIGALAIGAALAFSAATAFAVNDPVKTILIRKLWPWA